MTLLGKSNVAYTLVVRVDLEVSAVGDIVEVLDILCQRKHWTKRNKNSAMQSCTKLDSGKHQHTRAPKRVACDNEVLDKSYSALLEGSFLWLKKSSIPKHV